MKFLTYSIIAAMSSVTLFGCSDMDDMLPASGSMTEGQIEDTSNAISSRVNAALAGIYTYAGEMCAALDNSKIHCDYGYPSICTAMDANSADMVGDDSGYNWFTPAFDYSDRSPNYIIPQMRYAFLYKQIKLCNDVIGSIDPETTVKELQYSLAQARAVRAFDYLNITPYFQFNYATSKDKPCIPIVSNTTADPANNPRATVKEVYDFIMSDLNYAVEHLEGFTPTTKVNIDQRVAYGLRARANLYMENWTEAASDADKAMQGYTPASISDVDHPAFCDMNESNNWMWAIHTEATTIKDYLYSPAAHLGSFSSNGYASGTGTYKCINSFLFDKIPATDVRKGWWVDENLHSANLANCTWSFSGGTATGDSIARLKISQVKVPFTKYTNVKFGQREGIGSDNNAYDWPLMRVEEMILIKAEGLAMSGNTSEALTILNDFVKTYRDPSYSFNGLTADGIQTEIWKQRRIELWGEGFAMADIMRLHKPIVRIHGSNYGNWPSGFAFNISADDPYLLLRFPQLETNTNAGVTTKDNNEGTIPQSGQNGELLDGVTD